jgi:hypothetical protein
MLNCLFQLFRYMSYIWALLQQEKKEMYKY